MSRTPPPDSGTGPPHADPVPFGAALRFWFVLGCISFGGPAGQIALMHRELVERRRWISERRFLHALNYCMVLPGPEAQQLATYLGWLMHRGWGGIVAGALFVLPSLLLLIALSAVYMQWGQQPLVAGVFAGIKPAITAIVVQAAWRLGGRTLKNGVLWGIAALAFVALALLRLPFPALILGAALLGWLGARLAPRYFEGGAHGPRADGAATQDTGPAALIGDHTAPPPHARPQPGRLAAVLSVGLLLWALPMALVVAWGGTQGALAQMGGFFTKAALLSFGGAYAVLPYVWQGAVVQHGWLTPAQMIDGLALGETTPGPLIMVVVFVAFVGGWQNADLAAALPGPQQRFMAGGLAALLVTWVTFLPSFVFVLAGGPLVEATHGDLRITAPLTAITAAVVGVIAHLALFFAVHVLWPQGWTRGSAAGLDLPAALIALAAALALLRYRRSVIEVLAGCGLVGLLLALLR